MVLGPKRWKLTMPTSTADSVHTKLHHPALAAPSACLALLRCKLFPRLDVTYGETCDPFKLGTVPLRRSAHADAAPVRASMACPFETEKDVLWST